jgi:hypothetical protein
MIHVPFQIKVIPLETLFKYDVFGYKVLFIAHPTYSVAKCQNIKPKLGQSFLASSFCCQNTKQCIKGILVFTQEIRQPTSSQQSFDDILRIFFFNVVRSTRNMG